MGKLWKMAPAGQSRLYPSPMHYYSKFAACQCFVQYNNPGGFEWLFQYGGLLVGMILAATAAAAPCHTRSVVFVLTFWRLMFSVTAVYES
jgi:hypothetical protein